MGKKGIYIIVAFLAVLIVGGGILRLVGLNSIEKQLIRLDLEEDRLEMQYRLGEISFEQYAVQKSEIEVEEQRLEQCKDWLELDFD